MFTIAQIKEAHAKAKTGADYPRYIADICHLGVRRYTVFVEDGRSQYYGENDAVSSPTSYQCQAVALTLQSEEFQRRLRAHQEGKSSYSTFCRDCAELGIHRWEADLEAMTCTYYSTANDKVLVESIPSV